MKFSGLWLASVGVLALAACAAQGGVFQYGTEGWAADYEVAPGGTLAVEVYLYETFDPAAETAVLDDEEGLYSAGLKVERTSVASGEPAGVLSVLDIVHNLAFNESDAGVSPIKAVNLVGGLFDSATLLASRDILATDGVSAEGPSAGVRRVLLGTFTFTGGSVLEKKTDFRIADNDPALDDTVTWALPGVALDADILPFDFSITVVPEPATCALLGLGLASLLIRRKG